MKKPMMYGKKTDKADKTDKKAPKKGGFVPFMKKTGKKK